jgi:hypothetical protein
MPQWLTRWESLSCAYPKWPASNRNAGRLRFGTMAGFKSEWWPASSRYRGRLRVGIPGRIKSESAGNRRRHCLLHKSSYYFW